MAADKYIQSIIKQIEGSIEAFQKDIPAIQQRAFSSLLDDLKDLDTDKGRLLNSVQNLKKIGILKNKLERLIISEGYKDSVKDFVRAFDIVEGLQAQFFSSFNQKFKPSGTLKYIKELSVDQTVNGLLGQGLALNVVDAAGRVLQESITSGGSFAALTERMREHLTATDTDGTLQRHTRTITTDALNQYAAQYQETVAQDLNFNWGRYIGSNITTTREFCELLTAKEWVHRSELPEIVKGHIDGHSCKLSKSTGLPLGMIPGTDENNFKVRRGGWNCGHQFFWVPDSAVPKDTKSRFESGDQKQEMSAENSHPVIAAIQKKNEASLQSLKKRNIVFPDEILQRMPEDVTIVDDRDSGSFYLPDKKRLVIGGKSRADNEYYQKKIVLHEGGHAIHFNKNIITNDYVDPDFRKFYNNLKFAINKKEGEIDDALWQAGLQNSSDRTKVEQIGILHDALGGITKGKFGMGHTQSYYEHGNYSLMEVFVHSVTLARLDNEFTDLHSALAEMAKLMKEYGSNILKGE